MYAYVHWVLIQVVPFALFIDLSRSCYGSIKTVIKIQIFQMSFWGANVTVIIQRSEMRLRLDCRVATFVASRYGNRKNQNIPQACVARNHQADNLAKLRLEFLSVIELIAQIFCAV